MEHPGPQPLAAMTTQPARFVRTLLEVLAIVALVLVVQRVLLPRLGFST